MLKVPRQRKSHPTNATGTAHHRNEMPVASWSATDTPPISEARTRKLTRRVTRRGAMKNRTPKRSRSRST
jgi:hypothetical protein